MIQRTIGPTLPVVLLFTLLFPAAVLADPTQAENASLREIVKACYPGGDLLIGATTGSWAFGKTQGMLLDREFSYVTPENDFKQSKVHPYPGKWSWSQAIAWQKHVAGSGQVVRIHGPIGPQCSEWAKDDSRTAAELEGNMREFFTRLCERFNGVPGFESIDVVNETVVNGKWHGDKPGTNQWECPWIRIGRDSDPRQTPLYIRYAFEIAGKNAPDMKLIYNQQSLDTPSWDLIKETIIYLKNLGLRVDGIGWQAHVNQGWETPENLNKLRSLIDWAHRRGLEFHVTEASVWLNGNSPKEFEAQAATYRAILDVLLEKRSGGTVGWNTWHVSDAHGWKKDRYPSLFDDRYEPKPAYFAVRDALIEHARSDGVW